MIQQMLSTLQSAEVENKKMRDSFATYCSEKRQTTIKAKSDIEHLKDIIYITSYLYFRNRQIQPKLVGAPLYLQHPQRDTTGCLILWY